MEIDSEEFQRRVDEKRSILESELRGCQVTKQIELQIQFFELEKGRLLQEQAELMSERERCVQIEAQESGESDPSRPQWMDERLQIISHEVMMIEDRIYGLQVQCTTVYEDGTSVNNADQTWQNVDHLIQSCDTNEMLYVAGSLVRELVELRVITQDLQMKLSEKDTMIYELRANVDLMRSAAIDASMDYERRVNEANDYTSRILEFINAVYEQQQPMPENMQQFLNIVSTNNGSQPYVYTSQDSLQFRSHSPAEPSVAPSAEPLPKEIKKSASGQKTNSSVFLPELKTTGTENVATGSASMKRSQSKAEKKRDIKLDWKSLDILSGVSLDDQGLEVMRMEGNQKTQESIAPQSRQGLPKEWMQKNKSLDKLPAIQHPIVANIIETDKDEEIGRVQRRKSFDRILSFGKNAFKWAKSKAKGGNQRSMSLSLENQGSEQTMMNAPSQFSLDEKRAPYSFDEKRMSVSSEYRKSTELAPITKTRSSSEVRKHRSVSEELSREYQPSQKRLDLGDDQYYSLRGGIRKSKSVNHHLASSTATLPPAVPSNPPSQNDVFSRLAYSHTKASENRYKTEKPSNRGRF